LAIRVHGPIAIVSGDYDSLPIDIATTFKVNIRTDQRSVIRFAFVPADVGDSRVMASRH
jgi:hypothetical protein